MDENRFEGTARNLGGKVQEGVGRATGDFKTTTEGLVNQAAGTAQDLYGQTADAVTVQHLGHLARCRILTDADDVRRHDLANLHGHPLRERLQRVLREKAAYYG